MRTLTGLNRRALIALPLALLMSMPLLAAGKKAPKEEKLPTITELMRRLNDMWQGETSHNTMTMKVKTEFYNRELTMESWSRGDDDSVILVRAPDDFPRWLRASERKSKPPKPGRTADTPAFERNRPDQQRRYRVRLAQNSGSRTRSLSVTAASEEKARARALAEIEGDWRILEIRLESRNDSTEESRHSTRAAPPS